MKVLSMMKDRKRSFPFQFVQLYVHTLSMFVMEIKQKTLQTEMKQTVYAKK